MSFFDNAKAVTFAGKAVAKLELAGKKIWEAITFTNQVPISTDTDGSIFNGVGYIENRRLSSSGGLSSSAQNGSVTSGFIPFDAADVISLKGVEWLNAYTKYGGHYYLSFYDSSKKIVEYLSSETYSGGNYKHVITVTRDSNGVETFDLNESYGTSNNWITNIKNKAAFIRITAYGKGADMILTINEEIT